MVSYPAALPRNGSRLSGSGSRALPWGMIPFILYYLWIDENQSFADEFSVGSSNFLFSDPGADGDCLLYERMEIESRFFRNEVILSRGICNYQLGKGFIAHQANDTGNYPGFRGFVVPVAVSREY